MAEMSEIMLALIPIMASLGRIIGIIIIVMGVFSLILGMHNEERETSSNGLRQMISGMILVGLFSFIPNIIDLPNSSPELSQIEETADLAETEEFLEEEPVVETPVEETEIEPIEEVETPEPEVKTTAGEDGPKVRETDGIKAIIFVIVAVILGAISTFVAYMIGRNNREIKEETHEPEEKPVKSMSYDELISVWIRKATIFKDTECVELLNKIAEDMRSLDIYRGRGLIEDSAAERAYNLYFQDLPDNYNQYLSFIDVSTQGSREVINSIKGRLQSLHSTLESIITVEIDKTAEMTDMQIDASRTSLEAIAAQNGYGKTTTIGK
jgi:hypothetical protein